MKHVAPDALSGAFEERGGNSALVLKSTEDDADQIVTKALADFQKAVDNRLKEVETKSIDADKITARIDKVEAALQRPAVVAGDKDASLEKKAFANFLRSDLNSVDPVERKTLTVATDAAIGYVLAPEDSQRDFLRNLVEYSPVRTIADVRKTGSHTVLLPKRLTVTNAKWKGEAVASEASEPNFDEMEISIKEITTHVDIGNWLIEDGNDVEAEVNLALVEDYGEKEGIAFVNGAGDAVTPEGFMTNAEVAQVLNGHATNLSSDALITMMYALPATYRNRGTWTMNGTTLAAIRKLKDGAGNYLWQPAYASGQPETILGRPVVETKDMADIAANAFPIAFGDFKSGYRIYDRLDLIVRPNPYLLATEGKIRFHARRRVGAGVVRPGALRKLKMATA